MKFEVLLFFMHLLLNKGGVTSLRLLELRVPAHVAEGSNVLLGCVFDLENDTLYAVTWYKDDTQFYRYVEYNQEKLYFRLPGVVVDTMHSSKDTVWLKNVTNYSTGKYTCEVRGETPKFAVVSESKHIGVHLLPESGPIITGGQDTYRVGDIVDLNCTSSASRPETQLKWWLNDVPVTSDCLQGPWVRRARKRPGASVTALRLNFRVLSKHFQNGVMKLKCEATIAPMYNKATAVDANTYVDPDQLDPATEGSFIAAGNEEQWGGDVATPSTHNLETHDVSSELSVPSACQRISSSFKEKVMLTYICVVVILCFL